GPPERAELHDLGPTVAYSLARRCACSSYAASNSSRARSRPTTAAPLSTLGGWPAAVSRWATSALIVLISRHPPTVLPGLTGVSSPSIFTIASPGGAPVSSTMSEKSWSFLPDGWLLVDFSLWR